MASPAQSKLTFKSGGRLTELLVGVGDTVQEGQPLARLDDADLQIALQQAQAGYNSAVAKLEQTRAGTRPEEIASAQAQVEQARIKLNQLRAVNSGPDAAAAQSQVESARIKLSSCRPGAGGGRHRRAGPAGGGAGQAEPPSRTPARRTWPARRASWSRPGSSWSSCSTPGPRTSATPRRQLVSARAKLQALVSPRQEDLAAAQAQLDSARTKLAQLRDQPQTATPQDLANGELAVKNAQVAYDKALADSANAGKAGSSLTQAASDAAIKQALIALEQAQNDLSKLQQQGPTEWDVRAQQLAVEQAQASLDKLRNPAPGDVQSAQAAVEQAQASLDKIKSPSPYDVQSAQEGLNQAQASLDKLRNPAPADVVGAQQARGAGPDQPGQAAHPERVRRPGGAAGHRAGPGLPGQAGGGQRLRRADRPRLADPGPGQPEPQGGRPHGAGRRRRPGRRGHRRPRSWSRPGQPGRGGADGPLRRARSPPSGPPSGSRWAAGWPLVTLVDTRQVRVDVVVDETDVAKVQPGQTVNLTFDALPGQRIAGTVAVVAPTGTVTQGVVNYPVQIQVDPAQAQGVRPGMTATAQMVTQSKDNVVSVPNRALAHAGPDAHRGGAGGRRQTGTRQVQTGLANDQMTEILGGLQPGDRVVIPATTTAAANARVPGLGAAVPAGARRRPAGAR